MTATASTQPLRSEIPPEHTWDLSHLYPGIADWEADFLILQGELPKLAQSRRPFRSSRALLAALTLRDRLSLIAIKLEVYAQCLHHADTSNDTYRGMLQRFNTLNDQLKAAVVLIRLRILGMKEGMLNTFIQENAKLKVYEHHLKDIERYRPHVRTMEVEAILAALGSCLNTEPVYHGLLFTDCRCPAIVGSQGETLPLTLSNFIAYLMSSDRKTREQAWGNLGGELDAHKTTFAASYAANVGNNVTLAHIRHYPSSLAAALHESNVPGSIVATLVGSVRANLPHLRRSMQMRQRVLGIETLRPWDLYAPLAEVADYTVTYEEALEIAQAALAPLGKAYVAIVREIIKQRLLDPFANQFKYPNGYGIMEAGIPPYLLMNLPLGGRIGIKFLLALLHELGHSAHHILTGKVQPYVYGKGISFITEIAARVNEFLLLRYLLTINDDDLNWQLFVMDQIIDQFRLILYGQALFSEFEQEAHDQFEAGKPLTAESLTEIYGSLLTAYYGDTVLFDDLAKLPWIRVTYLWQPGFKAHNYVMSPAAAAYFLDLITGGGPGSSAALERYLHMLTLGASVPPVIQLQEAGFDPTSAAPYNAVFKMFGDWLDRFAQQHPKLRAA